MEVTEASVEVMEAFTEALSTAGIMEASVQAFMEDMEYMKASVNVYSTGASTKVSTKAFIQVISTKAFMSVMEAFVEVMESFMEMAYFNGILYGSFRGSFHENMQYSQASVRFKFTGTSTKASTKASTGVTFTKA